MDTNYEERNKSQIIRQDAKNCFVESKNDAFGIGKIHLDFATYDLSLPSGQRQTNNVNIYIDVPEFLRLTQEALRGILHSRARQQKANKELTPLYESLGGTSAEKLKQYGRERTDGKSLSRTVKLIYSDKKDDYYLFIADSGPGETDAKGLIVPKFGGKPENHVAVMMSMNAINEFLLMTKIHYEAWLTAKYVAENNSGGKPANTTQPNSSHQSPASTNSPQQNVSKNGDNTELSQNEHANMDIF